MQPESSLPRLLHRPPGCGSAQQHLANLPPPTRSPALSLALSPSRALSPFPSVRALFGRRRCCDSSLRCPSLRFSATAPSHDPARPLRPHPSSFLPPPHPPHPPPPPPSSPSLFLHPPSINQPPVHRLPSKYPAACTLRRRQCPPDSPGVRQFLDSGHATLSELLSSVFAFGGPHHSPTTTTTTSPLGQNNSTNTLSLPSLFFD